MNIFRLLLLLLGMSALAHAKDERVFKTGSDWETVSEGHQFAEGMAFDQKGDFYFTDVPRRQLFKIKKGETKKKLIDADTGGANGIAFGPDGRLYGCSNKEKTISVWDPKTWKRDSVAQGTTSNDIVVCTDGTIFFTDPPNQCVWRVVPGSWKRDKAVQLTWKPNGITISNNQQTLYVAEFASDTIHGFHIGKDKSLGKGKPAYRVKVEEGTKGALDGMMIHSDGRVLSGTRLGLQIAPPVHGDSKPEVIVFPIPDGLPRCNYVRISPDKKWLYVAHAKVVLRRELGPAFVEPLK